MFGNAQTNTPQPTGDQVDASPSEGKLCRIYLLYTPGLVRLHPAQPIAIGNDQINTPTCTLRDKLLYQRLAPLAGREINVATGDIQVFLWNDLTGTQYRRFLWLKLFLTSDMLNMARGYDHLYRFVIDPRAQCFGQEEQAIEAPLLTVPEIGRIRCTLVVISHTPTVQYCRGQERHLA